MPRQPRIVVPGLAHHVIQRGTRRQIVFFRDEDRHAYVNTLQGFCSHYQVLIWAWCLMDNHIHLVLVPPNASALAKAVGEAHKTYAVRTNTQKDWNGHLWQGRFLSFPVENSYLPRVIRYVERNPVRAGIVRKAEDYLWSSAKSHVRRINDPLLSPCPLQEKIPLWSAFLNGPEAEDLPTLRAHQLNGRPFAEKLFLDKLGKLLGRDVTHKPRGRKKLKN